MSKSAYLNAILRNSKIIAVTDNAVIEEHPVIGKILVPCLDAPFQSYSGLEISKVWIEEAK